MKPISIEARELDGDAVWSKFQEAAKASKRGAFLLAVVGGKLSEGKLPWAHKHFSSFPG